MIKALEPASEGNLCPSRAELSSKESAEATDNLHTVVIENPEDLVTESNQQATYTPTVVTREVGGTFARGQIRLSGERQPRH